MMVFPFSVAENFHVKNFGVHFSCGVYVCGQVLFSILFPTIGIRPYCNSLGGIEP